MQKTRRLGKTDWIFIIAAVLAALVLLTAAVHAADSDDSGADKPAPFKPAVTVDANQVTVTWPEQEDAIEYQVYTRPNYSDEDFQLAGTTEDPEYTFTGKYCTSYQIYVKAVIEKDVTYTKKVKVTDDPEKDPPKAEETSSENTEAKAGAKKAKKTRSKTKTRKKHHKKHKVTKKKKPKKKSKKKKKKKKKAKYKTITITKTERSEADSKKVKFETGSDPSLPVKRIASLRSKRINENYNASRTDGICFVGDDLYYLKSAHSVTHEEEAEYPGFYPMVIGCIENFADYSDTQNPPVTFHTIRYPDGSLYYGAHGSSITYYDGSFYIVTVQGKSEKGRPIIKVNRSGVVQEEIDDQGFYMSNRKFSAMAFFGTTTDADGNTYPQFICRDGKNKNHISSSNGYELHRFSVGTLKGDVLQKDYSFMTEDTKDAGFWQKDRDSADPALHSNDIGYDPDTGTLYHTIFIYEQDHNIKDNWVYSYDVSSAHMNWPYQDNTKILPMKSVTALSLHPENSSETKFEAEGVDTYQGNVYIGVNTDGVDDSLYMIRK